MIVERLRHEHFAKLRVAEKLRAQERILNDLDYQDALIAGEAFAGIGRDGTPAAISGIINAGGGRALAWQWTGSTIRAERYGVHRAVKRFLDTSLYRRIEMTVNPQDPLAIRWAIKLGFEFETAMRSWYPDGSECFLFARIQNENAHLWGNN